ncbi:HET-domain-containing protein, partial [Lophium mytilinum]
MRLLKLDDSGEFGLQEFYGDDVPDYAILSHTWGDANEEVTFKDLADHTAKEKEGYKKIDFCGKQAATDNLQYFWIDTCCIDRASSAELQESINYMWRWYRESKRCYVCLSDVSKKDEDDQADDFVKEESETNHLARSTSKSTFRRSKWFTRGWTLQELIAPSSVEFFSLEGVRICDKKSMEQQIHKITGIAIRALRGDALSTFSFDERMSWAVKRNTTREEDQAYSLLGIFDIHMTLLYSEGKENAFARLEKKYREGFQTPLDARLMKIRQWLSPPDPSINYHKALKQRQADTGIWFLESDEFANWKIDAHSYIWLHGIPGCGKTILSSTILQNVLQYCVDNNEKVVAYFFFDFNDAQKQVPELMIRSLISQLSQQCVKMPTALETFFASCQSKKQPPSLDDLLEVLHQMILVFPQSYLILDALDECADRAVLMDLLETMAGWRLYNLHVLVTSRKEHDIESSLESIVEKQNTICLETKLVDKDIQKYVRGRLRDDKSLRKWQKDPIMRREIEARLMEGAHGMFRWAACQLGTLGQCCNRSQLRKSLATLPPTLDETYNRILCAIDDINSEYAVRILRWLTFSSRPLSLDEVTEVIAIDPERDPAFDGEEVLEDPADVLRICSSLVTITTIEEPGKESDDDDGLPFPSKSSNPTGQTVALAHYSVKEYLVSERCRQSQAARYSMQHTPCNEFISKCCLGYILQFSAPDSVSAETLLNFKLADYSARFWIRHAQLATSKEIKDSLTRLILKLFSTRNGAYLNWIRLCDVENSWRDPDVARKLEDVRSPLYYASFSGLIEVVRLLSLGRAGADLDAQGGEDGNALQGASRNGHIACVELLLDKGANVNRKGEKFFYNPLQTASIGGHLSVVKLLLGRGADVNAEGGYY